MSEITGGELLVRCLAAEDVKFVFGLPCPEVDPILAKLEEYGIRFVPIRHEAGAVHMAEGLYKTTGHAAAVLGNPGPGSANLLPGVITARHEGVPVVVITAQHRLGIVYPSPPSTFQGQDQLERLPAGHEVERADPDVGANTGSIADRVPRNVERQAGAGAYRGAGANHVRDGG